MKDYYDIYLFLTKLKNDIDINILKEAIKSTFTKRNSFEYLKDYDVIIDSIINNERIEKLWSIYSNKYKYAKCININEILNLLKKIIKNLNLIIWQLIAKFNFSHIIF